MKTRLEKREKVVIDRCLWTTLRSIAVAIPATFLLTGCEHLAGVRFGACYENACVSVTLPPKPPVIVETGK